MLRGVSRTGTMWHCARRLKTVTKRRILFVFRDNVSSSRKEELKKLLNSQVPIVLATMAWVLESLMSYFRGRDQSVEVSTGSTTPPPSPSPSLTNDESSSDSSDPMMFSNFTQSLLSVATNKLQLSAPEHSVVEASALALKCLTHLFTWVPLTTVITARLLASIFHFVTLGFHCTKVSDFYLFWYFESKMFYFAEYKA